MEKPTPELAGLSLQLSNMGMVAGMTFGIFTMILAFSHVTLSTPTSCAVFLAYYLLHDQAPVLYFWELVGGGFFGLFIVFSVHEVMARMREKKKFLKENSVVMTIFKVGKFPVSVVCLASWPVCFFFSSTATYFMMDLIRETSIALRMLVPFLDPQHPYAFMEGVQNWENVYAAYFNGSSLVSSHYFIRFFMGCYLTICENPYRILFFLAMISMLVVLILWYFVPDSQTRAEEDDELMRLPLFATPFILMFVCDPAAMFWYLLGCGLMYMILFLFVFYKFWPLIKKQKLVTHFFSMFQTMIPIFIFFIMTMITHHNNELVLDFFSSLTHFL